MDFQSVHRVLTYSQGCCGIPQWLLLSIPLGTIVLDLIKSHVVDLGSWISLNLTRFECCHFGSCSISQGSAWVSWEDDAAKVL